MINVTMRALAPAVLVVGLMAAPMAKASPPEFDINAICKRTAQFVGGSASIELSCRRTEATAKSRLEELQVPDAVMAQCVRTAQFAQSGYTILEACVRQELTAQARLNQPAPPATPSTPRSALGDEITKEIRQRCGRMQSSGGYMLVESCIQQEEAAAIRVGPRISELEAHHREVLNLCGGMITSGGYPLFENCIDQELAAKKRVGR